MILGRKKQNSLIVSQSIINSKCYLMLNYLICQRKIMENRYQMKKDTKKKKYESETYKWLF